MPAAGRPIRRPIRPPIGAAASAIAAAALTAALAPAVAGAASQPPSPAGTGAERAFVEDEVVVGLPGGGERVVRLPPGVRPGQAVRSLSGRPGVRYANRNWVATAAVDPLDRGRSGEVGGWRDDQWNFLGKPGGVRAPRAWDRLEEAGRPGATGVTVAVVDTGVAFAGPPPARYAPSPDFARNQFVAGQNFAGSGLPLDENGHGTHVAGTIAAQITLRRPASPDVPDLTGLAYNATLMPVRVLDRGGAGTTANVAKGILWAARHGADVINVSLQLPNRVRSCKQARGVCQAVREARRAGALVVAAAGNVTSGGRGRVLFPAAAPGVVAVGGSTESGCLSAFSHYGSRLDLVAPGGGHAFREAARRRCRGDKAPVRQVSFPCFPDRSCSNFDRFEIRPNAGTSMAAAHVSGVAALTLASRANGGASAASAKRLRKRLLCTARRLGQPRFYGAGLVDAARATSARTPSRCRR